MPFDVQRILEAAAQAALSDSSSSQAAEQGKGKRSARRGRRRVTGPRAFLLGAGIVTAGRLVSAARRGEVLHGIQERLLEYEHRHFGDEGPEDEFEEDEENETEDENEEEDENDEEDEEDPEP